MKLVSIIAIATAIVLAGGQSGRGQGFANLDFEDATVSATPVNEWGDYVDPALAFPSWTIGSNYTATFYNDLSLGASAVGLMGPNFPNAPGYTSLQGSYSVLLECFGYPSISPPTLSQTGLVPVGAKSINFLVGADTGAVVTLNGINIPLVPTSGGRLAGDITAFGGNIAQLTFSTSTSGGTFYFDDIQFSSQSVPEPSGLALMALGVLFLGFRHWRNSR